MLSPIAICQNNNFLGNLFYYCNINLGHPLWMAINFNTFFNHNLSTQNLEFSNTRFYIIYEEEKSTWSNFNYLVHDDTWTKVN